MCVDDSVDHSTVSRWASRLSGESGHTNIRDIPPAANRTQHKLLRMCSKLTNVSDKRVTKKVLSFLVEIGEERVSRILEQSQL